MKRVSSIHRIAANLTLQRAARRKLSDAQLAKMCAPFVPQPLDLEPLLSAIAYQSMVESGIVEEDRTRWN